MQALKKYHKLWTSDIGRELMLGMKLRSAYKKLSDERMSVYLNKLNNQKSIETINKHGDMDYPSKLAIPLFTKNPSLLKLLPSALRKKERS
jgi:hypothetical protein